MGDERDGLMRFTSGQKFINNFSMPSFFQDVAVDFFLKIYTVMQPLLEKKTAPKNADQCDGVFKVKNSLC